MKLSVYEAAKKLGITESAVRQRAYRGTLRSEKGPDGRLFVYVAEQDTQHNDQVNGAVEDYINALKSQVGSLEADKEKLDRDKEHLREESVRKDHIIMSLTQRIPAIEAPEVDAEEVTEPRESAVSDSETEAKGAVPQDSAEAEIRQPWWKRWFRVSPSE
jgi:predicted transcriptional regulator